MMETDSELNTKTLANIISLTKDIDQRFDTGLKLMESQSKRDSINKANTIWKEYKKTLLDEVLPSVSQGDVALKPVTCWSGCISPSVSTPLVTLLRQWLTHYTA